MAWLSSTQEMTNMEAVAVPKGTFWHLAADDCRVGRGLARSYSDSALLGAAVTSDVEVASTCADDVASVTDLCCSDSADECTTCGETRWSESGTDDECSTVSSGAEGRSLPQRCLWVQAAPVVKTVGQQSADIPLATPSKSSKKRSPHGTHGRRSKRESQSSVDSEVQELTTMMLKNIPTRLTRAALLELFDAAGFQGLYDFVYLPIDFDSDVNLGYAFVNMSDGDASQEFWKAFDGFCAWGGDRVSTKVCRLEWSKTQGLDAHVQRYRNSPLLHSSSPDERRPILLNEGVRAEFPPPTCSIKAPRRKGRH